MTTRTAINPTSWSTNVGFDQAQVIEGHQRLLVCSGQDAVDDDGNVQHPGDMRAQLELALDNLASVVAGADMTLGDIVRLNVYTTDVDALAAAWAAVMDRFADHGRFVTSVLGVTRLFAPDVLVMLEAIAVA